MQLSSVAAVVAFTYFSSTLCAADADATPAAQVPFTVQNFVAAGHARFHVQGGIPLPRGMARTEAAMAVQDEDGAPVEAEVGVTGYWPDGSVKWVLVGMQPALEPSAVSSYVLCMQDNAAKSGDDGKPIARQDGERIHVDTGRVRFTVNRKSAGLFETLSFLRNGEAVASLKEGHAGSALFVEIERRREGLQTRIAFEANADKEEFSAELEQASPLRAVIRVDGVHAADDGTTFAPYTLRIYAYKDSSLLRFAHTFIYDGEPREDFLRALGVRLTLQATDVTGYTFGGDQGLGVYTKYVLDESLPAWRRGVLSQDSARHYAITKAINPVTNSRLRVTDGRRSQGWATLETSTGRLAAGIKNFWQEYPKAIEVDCEDRSVTAYFYSPHSDALDLRRYSDLGYHSLYEAGAAGPGTPATPFNHEKYNARYISKTTEMFLEFFPVDAPATAHPANTALLFQRPPLLRPSMTWIASTNVFGDYAAAEQGLHGSAAAHVQDSLDFLVDEQEYRGWYSFIDYGDVMHSFDASRDSWCFDEGGYAWINNEAQICGASWMAYLCSGDERGYRFAEAMTRHVQDVDMYQMGPLAGCGMRHNVNHWGCVDRERRMTIPYNKRVYYFLTGDEHTRDRIRFIHEQLSGGPREFAAMDLGVGATALLFLWETTGDARYGELLAKATEAYCARSVGGYGFPASFQLNLETGEGSIADGVTMLPSFFLVSFGPMSILMDSYELTGSEKVKEAVLNWATLLLMPEEEAAKHQKSFGTGQSGAIANMAIAQFAYRHTGDARYLDYIRKGLSKPVIEFENVGGDGPLDVPPHRVMRGELRRWQTNMLAATLFNYPCGMGVLGRKSDTEQ
jgi:PcRGLX-like protein C-terminal alpha/alpha toroid domain/PcRGLX-like protein central beta sandwich domain/PcRGLX-like N-terminal RIFT barrel domain